MSRKYAWTPSLPDFRDHKFKLLQTAVAIPEEVDLRSSCPQVYDQADIGSCTANAVGAAYQYDLKKQGLKDFTPSRLFIYYNERVLDGSVNNDAGSMLRIAAKVINKQGVCDEVKWPYVTSRFTKKPTKSCYTFGLKHVSTSYESIDNTDLRLLQGCLASGYPFVFGFTVYESFQSEAVAKTGILPFPQTTEKCLGGHAVMCVGYKQLNGKLHFIVRNSWGTDWGDQGHFHMPFDYLTNSQLATDFWKITAVSA